MKFIQTAISLLLASSSAVAAPTPAPLGFKERMLARANAMADAPRKRLALWEWTLTRDVNAYPGIRSSAEALAGSSVVAGTMNWETWTPDEVNLPHFPMARQPDIISNPDAWRQLTTSLERQKQQGVAAPLVHFLNEPERQGVSAGEAANLWRQSFLPLRAQYGAALVGPAPASDPNGGAWLDEFMFALGDGEKPDYVGVHYYTSQNLASDVEAASAQAYIAGQALKYGLPVVVSEIASTNRDYAQVEAFTREMIAWLDAQDNVFQYGFFGMSREPTDGFVSPAAQLLDRDGNLTNLGRIYALNA